MQSDDLVPDNNMGHAGEIALRKRYPGTIQWDEERLAKMMRQEISQSHASFIEAQPFFFIATASAQGHCDASFRGSEVGPDGTPGLACKVLSSTKLVFPDYSGNGLYNSLGNIASNPHIGMIFIDFTKQTRIRLNGTASIRDVEELEKAMWPNAQAIVEVIPEQVYGNCRARIPKMLCT
ncbi:pyridoxamine 5'-phosphate oxidase family protein [Polycladidibacter stylochi]|uniref:pyridoxamine 5'-phosphate oxidase family protein n=1 Tax=Polycladidibacter stylochi TaxID=1807766 RepID=UPI00082FA717|nr:pyridoxamine 5'-phosphate oxidase family protein [Pseudovibrio stylochi]